MAEINLYRIIKKLDNREFKTRLREAVQKFVPDVKLDMDKLFDAFVDRLEFYDNHSVTVDDNLVEIKEK